MSAIKREIFKDDDCGATDCTCNQNVDRPESLCAACKKEYEEYLDYFFDQQSEENSIAAFWKG